jgi:hypothetical protein
MNSNDTRLRLRGAHAADSIDYSGRWPSLALLADAILGAAGAMRAGVAGWLRDLGSSTQLGPDAEQVIGRTTGART